MGNNKIKRLLMDLNRQSPSKHSKALSKLNLKHNYKIIKTIKSYTDNYLHY